jgi:hypothetical protein
MIRLLLQYVVCLAAGVACITQAERVSPRLGAEDTPNAASRLAALRKTAREAREKHDGKAYLAAIQELAELVNHSGPATENLVMAYAVAGEQEKALEELRQFITMGQADARLGTMPQLESLRGNGEFQRLLKLMEQNQAPIQRATAVTEFPDAGLVPEDLDYDAPGKSFLATSVLEKKIVRLSFDGKQQDFAASPSGWPMLALKIDAQRRLVWATEAALNQFAVVPEKDWGRSALLCFRLADAAVVRRIEGPPHSALGDMALTAEGDVIVSDGEGGGVYRLRADAPKDAGLERLDAGEFISPQTPAALPDGRHVFVPDYTRGISVLDLVTKQVRWIEGGRKHALQGIDGLYFRPGTLIATQNGSSPERVVLFHLDPGTTRVLSEEVVERATSGLGDPTHGVVIGDDFYYIANSGWDSLDDNGKTKPNARMTRARLMKTPLKAS